MKIVQTLEDLREERSKMTGPVGLVPTMGFLHAGHISLVKQAVKECANVVVSIYVNPTQFSPTEDFASYPRDLDRDAALLKEAGATLVWAPTDAVMYPSGYQTYVNVEDVTKVLEGAMRPTHFRGVTTVVAKLFNAVQPDKAFFGQKDAQQVAVLSRMVKDLNFNLEMVVCPIVREKDGLALSSRNTYLDTAQRQAALVLSRALRKAREIFINGERESQKIRSEMEKIFTGEPAAKVQYISIADTQSLLEVEWIETQALVSMAVYIGKTRLIDNTILGKPDPALDKSSGLVL
ncbi:MAG: pantoate--beta-alanine ligase [Leptolinea sp.]|jgi:pantoate--beta-alanine ligase|nr:pantoate--beta-alanine ligase [Leptolinea sp.]